MAIGRPILPLAMHGGPNSAAYAHPCGRYTYWCGEFPSMELPWGMFGENCTVAGLREETINIGDQFRIASGVVMVIQPRVPCYELAAKFGREDIIKRFLASGRSGFYCKLVQEGEVGAGDTIEAVSHDRHAIAVADIARLYNITYDTQWNKMIHRLLSGPKISALPKPWLARKLSAFDWPGSAAVIISTSMLISPNWLISKTSTGKPSRIR